MRSFHSSLVFVALAAVLSLGACDPKPSPPKAGAPQSSSATDPTHPAATVNPQSPQASDVVQGGSGHGPSDGASAVGGLAGNQEKGGAASGGTPAPTGGDGAAGGAPK